MAVITLSTIVDALDANLNQLYLDGLNSWDEQYSVIFNVETSDNATEQDSYISGFPIMPEKAEGTAATYSSLIAGIKKTYVNKTYALNHILGVLKSNFEVIKRAISVEALCIG